MSLSLKQISLMIKRTFEKEESKVLIYRGYKDFKLVSSKSELLSEFHQSNVSFTTFENNFIDVLNNQASKTSNVFCGNQKPHVNKSLIAAIMKCSPLSNKTNEPQLPANTCKYKNQHNLVVQKEAF